MHMVQAQLSSAFLCKRRRCLLLLLPLLLPLLLDPITSVVHIMVDSVAHDPSSFCMQYVCVCVFGTCRYIDKMSFNDDIFLYQNSPGSRDDEEGEGKRENIRIELAVSHQQEQVQMDGRKEGRKEMRRQSKLIMSSEPHVTRCPPAVQLPWPIFIPPSKVQHGVDDIHSVTYPPRSTSQLCTYVRTLRQTVANYYYGTPYYFQSKELVNCRLMVVKELVKLIFLLLLLLSHFHFGERRRQHLNFLNELAAECAGRFKITQPLRSISFFSFLLPLFCVSVCPQFWTDIGHRHV